MFNKKKEKKELTEQDRQKLDRIHVLQEYVHQLDTDRNLSRISDAEWFKQIRMVEEEVSQMERMVKIPASEMKWEIFND